MAQNLLTYSQVTRLLLSNSERLDQPVVTYYKGELHHIWAIMPTNTIPPELAIDVTTNVEEAMNVRTFIEKLAYLYFDIGDLTFDLQIELEPEYVLIKDL